MRCGIALFALFAVASAYGQPAGVVLTEDFASDAWAQHMKQGPGGKGNTVQRTSAAGRTALLLRDDDPAKGTALDVTLDLPNSGRVSGFVLLPSLHEGARNESNAYFAVQLLGASGGPLISLSGHRATGIGSGARQLEGSKPPAVELPGVLHDDVWVPWQIAWEWDGVSPQGRCRVSAYDKETDPLPFSAASLKLLRVISGWSAATNTSVLVTGLRIEADAQALASSLPNDALRRAPFAMTPGRRVLTDTFDQVDPANANVPAQWYTWKHEADQGHFVYDRGYGRRDHHSVCLDGTSTGVWQRKVPVRPGALYRFSAWIRAQEAEPKGSVSVAMQPRVISRVSGKEDWADSRSVQHEIVPQLGYWQYLETFWTAPAAGEYPEGKLTLIDVEFIGKALKGKVWCDDARLEEVEVTAPWRDDFKNAAEVLAAWRVYGFHGLEGQAEVVPEPVGFGDAGALRVRHLRGQVGFSAAQELRRAAFGALRDWTLLVHATGEAEGVPALNVQQLDDKGEILETTASPAPTGKGGWREHRVSFALQPRTARVRLQLTNNGKGSAVFDNAWLRPAQADEVVSPEKSLPVMFRVFPADVIAAIDATPAVITIPAGQTGAFNLHLYGDRESKAQTRVEIEAPDWLGLRTAQVSLYADKPLEAVRAPAKQQGRTVYAFTDPFDWKSCQSGNQPSAYQGLLTLWRAEARPGTEDTIVVRTFLGDQVGETRTIKLAVRPPIPQAPALRDFSVGIWNMTCSGGVLDAAAYRELLQTYVEAGVRRGLVRAIHAPVRSELGFRPVVGLWMYIISPSTYRSLPEAQRPPLALTVDGAPTTHFIALGVALNDPAVHAAYRAFLEQRLREFPDAVEVFEDIEFWGDGNVSKSDFHPSTIAEFRKRAGIPADQELTPERILKEHYAAWSAFRNDVTAELHGLTRRFLQELRPGMKLRAYAYSLAPGGKPAAHVTESPMDTLRYEAHVDGHLISTYNLEGARFLDGVDNDTRHLRKPVWTVPFLMKNIDQLYDRNYNYNQISARELRFELVGAAASGAKGLLGFIGFLMDADFLHAYAEGATAVAKYEDLYLRGERQDALVRLVDPAATVRHRVHVLDGRRLLTLFNGGAQEVPVVWERDGKRTTTTIPARDFAQVELP